MTDSVVAHRDAEPLVQKSDLINQISHGPTLNEVAAHLLRSTLKERYPDLGIDPERAFVGSPQWQLIDDHVQRTSILYESLTHALVRNGLYGTIADYLEGEQFLTLEPEVDNPVQLAVGIEDIAIAINEAVSLLFIDFQDRQLSFWNQQVHDIPRWQKLSDSLRKALNVNQVEGWDADECAMAREIFTHPDPTTRHLTNPDLANLQACLIDMDVVEHGKTRHLLLAGALVIKANCRQRSLVVMYTIERGYESFDALETLGNSLPERLSPEVTTGSLKWRLFEPDGNVFDSMASALISSQIDSINFLGSTGADTETPEPEQGINELDDAGFKQLDAAVPAWLSNAPANDIDDYRRYVTALGKLYRKPKYKFARTEIPSIRQFAHQSMRDAIIADKTAVGATALPWDDLRIEVTNSFTVDNFTLPNPYDHHVETLAEFALENDAPYLATLSFEKGTQVPAWLTAAYLTRMASKVDVGNAYPALINSLLINDKNTSRRQADFYRDQLRWLLPLKALEAKIKKEAGIDERGYQFICTWLNAAPGPLNPIAIYPLTLTPQHRLITSSDTVTNMFIISPRNAIKGPCLLYRPMQDVPLMQFPSRQNLLYALHQPGELRDSVLAWLTNKKLSFEYSQYVFPAGLPSPWLAAEQLVNPFFRADRFGRVVLDTQEISGDILTVLFRRNAQALVTLADRQSQSNAERRWRLLKDSSWALFSVASNFLSGAVGTAVWAWQIIEQLQQTLDAHKQGNSFIQWKSETDILLALGIVLSHHAVMRRKALSAKPRVDIEPLEESITPAPIITAVTQDPTTLVGELPAAHESLVETAGTVPRRNPSALSAYLDTFIVTPPDLDSDQVIRTTTEKSAYLYHWDDKTYAKVGERWFNVNVSEDAQVQVILHGEKETDGPLLASDHDGRWVLDLRLRLKGGGPKNRIAALKAANQRRKKELRDKLDLFQQRKSDNDIEYVEGSEEQAKHAVVEAKKAFSESTEQNRSQLTAAYVEKIHVLIEAYQQALEQLREWHALGGDARYLSESVRMHIELENYLAQWFFFKKREYSLLTSTLQSETMADEPTMQAHIVQLQEVADLSEAMVEKLVLSGKELGAMEKLGRSGITPLKELRRLGPTFTEWELKANEMGIFLDLCVEQQPGTTMLQARDDLADVIIKSARAAHRIAKLLRGTPGADTPEKQMMELGQLIDTFADVRQQLQDLPQTYPGHYKQVRLDHLTDLAEAFAQKAIALRLSLLEEHQAWQPREVAGPSKQPAPRPPGKVKKPRPPKQTSTETATHDDTPIAPITLDARRRPALALSDRDIIIDASSLSEGANAFIARNVKDATRPSRVPADVQELFDRQASKLEESATKVDQVLARSHEFPVRSLPWELRTAATKMRHSGISTRADLYRLKKPEQALFQWLYENNQVELRRDEGRIKTKQMGDYFQEYKILDKTRKNRELWVAHFHYPSLNSPAETPSAAHLKVSETYLKTLTKEQQKTLTTVEPIDGFLRRLDNPEVRKLFFALEPEGPKDQQP